MAEESSSSGTAAARQLTIRNRNGLHARPAALFVKTAGRFQGEVWVEKDGERVNGKSIMGLMMLAAGQGSVLMVTAEGPDAATVLDHLQTLVDSHFGEE